MALREGSSKVISQSIDSYQRIKRRLRDYTIPVRLNQLPPATATRITNGNEGICYSSGNYDNSSSFSHPSASSFRLFQFRKQNKSLTNQTMRFVVDKISAKSNKSLSTPPATECSNKMTVTLVAAIALLTISAKTCNCDTQQQPPTSLKDSSSYSVSSSSASVSSSSSPATTTATAKVSTNSNSHALVSSSSSRHRENLLSILADSIERQHFKIKPVRAFVQQRPSKFDSGEEYGSVEFGEAAANFIQKASNRTKQQHQSYQHHRHNGGSGGGGDSSTLKKNDDGMMQILRMHEQLASQSTANKRPASSSTPPEAPNESSSSSFNNNGIAGKWRELTRAPARVASSLIVNPNKMVSQVLSYISPLVGPKLLEHGPLVGLLKSAPSAIHNVLPSNNSSTTTRFRLNPFAGRSNNQVSIGGSFFGEQQQAGAEENPAPQKSSVSSMANAFVTALPLTSYLVKPDTVKAIGANIKGDKQQQKFPSTQPTKFFDHLDTTSQSELKVAARRPDMYSKDLLMADSSPQSSTSAISAMSFTSANNEQAQTSTSTPNTNIKQSGESPKGSLRKTSDWLKATTNQMTHNYIQDSLRGLLTLSQLPILSAERPSSTTTSSLFENKGSQQQKPSTTNQFNDGLKSQNQWRRNLEELYRLAYILATGMRRKKDPLLALESSSPAATQISSLSLQKNPLKRGVFSQRSLNEFLAANHKQLLNYMRRMRSNLATKPSDLQSDSNKFKPRGVMWDMATDPTLAVTVFHLLERASIALPLGFLLMPFVKMIHNPLSGMDLGALLPARATHRSVDYEELAKQIDFVDKMLSRALKPTHREA